MDLKHLFSKVVPEQEELGQVWCHGCQANRTINSAYLPYVEHSGIKNCKICRDSEGEL